MDDVTALRRFRADADVPAEQRAAARRALEQAMAGRERRRRPLLALVAAALLLLVLGGAAFALAEQFLVGDPAPPAVEREVALQNAARLKGLILPRLRRDPDALAAETRLGAWLKASTGPVYLWVAPMRGGGDCMFLQVVGTELPDGRPNLGGGCHAGAVDSVDADFSAVRVSDGRLLEVVSGRVSEDVRRLELVTGAEAVPIALQGRFFLHELRAERERTPFVLVARDGAGRELGRVVGEPRTAARFQRGLERLRTAFDTIDKREPLIDSSTLETRKPLRLYVFELEGRTCSVVTIGEMKSGGCSVRRPSARQIAVGETQIGSAPNALLLLCGPVGSAIRQLELRFEDGRSEELPLVKGWTLFEVDPSDYAEGRRAVAVVGRDANGEVVAKRRLW